MNRSEILGKYQNRNYELRIETIIHRNTIAATIPFFNSLIQSTACLGIVSIPANHAALAVFYAQLVPAVKRRAVCIPPRTVDLKESEKSHETSDFAHIDSITRLTVQISGGNGDNRKKSMLTHVNTYMCI